MDTIYLIQNKRIPDQYKIGITGNWAQRSRQLEVGTKTTCVTTARVNDPRSLESHLHRKFDADRLPQSEWFHLSNSQLQFVQSAFRKAEGDCQEIATVDVAALIQERKQAAAERSELIRMCAEKARAYQELQAKASRLEREELKRELEQRPQAIREGKVGKWTRRGALAGMASMVLLGFACVTADVNSGTSTPNRALGTLAVFSTLGLLPGAMYGSLAGFIAGSIIVKREG